MGSILRLCISAASIFSIVLFVECACPDKFPPSVLIEAALKGDEFQLTCLIDKGADLNSQGKNG